MFAWPVVTIKLSISSSPITIYAFLATIVLPIAIDALIHQCASYVTLATFWTMPSAPPVAQLFEIVLCAWIIRSASPVTPAPISMVLPALTAQKRYQTASTVSSPIPSYHAPSARCSPTRMAITNASHVYQQWWTAKDAPITQHAPSAPPPTTCSIKSALNAK